LTIISIIWLLFDLIDYILFYYFEVKLLGEYQFIFLELLRNYFLLIISGIYPLTLSYQEKFNLPICTTKECASNFNLLLITEKTYDAFMKFLNKHSPDGSKLLLLWTELNVFKHSNKTTKKEISYLATEIYDKYLKENSENYVDIPFNIIEKIQQSYKSLSKNNYHPSFDELLEYVFNTLKDIYYPNFKISDDYKFLEKDLETDEIIYSRLLASSMISSIDIE
jgi:Regulator of G protein signaling domain